MWRLGGGRLPRASDACGSRGARGGLARRRSCVAGSAGWIESSAERRCWPPEDPLTGTTGQRVVARGSAAGGFLPALIDGVDLHLFEGADGRLGGGRDRVLPARRCRPVGLSLDGALGGTPATADLPCRWPWPLLWRRSRAALTSSGATSARTLSGDRRGGALGDGRGGVGREPRPSDTRRCER